VNEREKLEKRINEQGKIAQAQIEKQREAMKELVAKEAEYKSKKAEAAHNRQFAEEQKKRELLGRR
jgi:hypothetical protein